MELLCLEVRWPYSVGTCALSLCSLSLTATFLWGVLSLCCTLAWNHRRLFPVHYGASVQGGVLKSPGHIGPPFMRHIFFLLMVSKAFPVVRSDRGNVVSSWAQPWGPVTFGMFQCSSWLSFNSRFYQICSMYFIYINTWNIFMIEVHVISHCTPSWVLFECFKLRSKSFMHYPSHLTLT